MCQLVAGFARLHMSSLTWQWCSIAKAFCQEMPGCHNKFLEDSSEPETTTAQHTPGCTKLIQGIGLIPCLFIFLLLSLSVSPLALSFHAPAFPMVTWTRHTCFHSLLLPGSVLLLLNWLPYSVSTVPLFPWILKQSTSFSVWSPNYAFNFRLLTFFLRISRSTLSYSPYFKSC